jgi:hypothetical protein
MKSIAMLILSLITLSANAQRIDLNGTWTGTGIKSSSEHYPVNCSNFTFNFRQTEDNLELVYGEASCENGPQPYVPFILNVKDGHLSSPGDSDFSGEITSKSVTATWLVPYDNSEYTMRFDLINGEIHYSDVARTLDGTTWFKLESILQKK